MLPDYSVLHKQDWYVKEEYHPDWQKTAYEMRESDWSSDVCSSDLRTIRMYH